MLGKKISVLRESVCMADDLEEHKIIIKINRNTKLCDFLSCLLKTRFLALISGGKATWVLKLNDILLAVVAQEWDEPKYLVNRNKNVNEILNESPGGEVYFKYLAQINPEKTYQKLKKAVESNLQVAGSLREYLKDEY